MSQQNLTGKLLSGRYRIERLLARGGMASVYLAVDERLEREVAIKVIYQHLAEDSSFKAKFLQEAKMAARLSHPNIVNIFDQGHDGELIYLAMEYVPSITLRDALTRFGAIGPKRALELFAQILEGLAQAHEKNVLHRDIKPENVFLADDGRVKLGDFGLARQADAHTSTGSLVGTIAYLSPELITRGQADARSDVYAAGIMLYEMLTGKQPFQGTEVAYIAHQHTTTDVPAPSELNPQIPALLDELVLWATARSPEHRPANAQALLAVTKRAQAELAAGRGSTAKLEIPEFAKTSVLPANELNNATEVLGSTEASGSTIETQQFSDFEQNATAVIDSQAAAISLSPLEQFAIRRRRRSKWITLLIATSAFVAAIAGWWLSAGPAALTGIPNLSNRTVVAAVAALKPYNAQITQKEINSKTVPEGLVIKTEPSAGSLFWRGSKLVLVVSKGPVMVSVPSLNTLTQQAAAAALKAAGFKVGNLNESFSDFPAGTVYNYQGSDGTKLAEGSAVDLEISLGKVPSVAGISQADAVSALQAVNLSVSDSKTEYSDKVAKGLVIRLEPVQNPLRAGDEVVLIVSKGPTTVVMPKVIGETLAAAQKLLQSLGLKAIVNTDQLTSQWGVVKVKSTSAKAGSILHLGDSVTISNR